MDKFQVIRIENAIAFFAWEHKKKVGRLLPQTALYKYLSLFEFETIEESGELPLGLDYYAMERGPVPLDIYNKRANYKTDLFEFIKGKGSDYNINPLKNADLTWFSGFEISHLKKLIEIYATSDINTNIMSNASHERIMAWKKTWETKPNSPIDPKKTFKGDITKKRQSELSDAEDKYLVALAFKEAFQTNKKTCL